MSHNFADALHSPGQQVVRRFALASVVANVVIVVTGGAVRLTGSGLGCPTWPHCTGSSFVPHDALGVHGVVEFSNRMLTYVLAAVVIATFVVVWRHRPARRSLRVLVSLLVLSIPAQAVVGGITVLTDLNPWVVSLHFMFSMVLVALSTLLVRRVGEGDEPPAATVPVPTVWLARGTYAALAAVLYIGTVVTGSGPHAGDVHAPRNGLSPDAMSQLHTDLVMLLIGLTVGLVLTLRTVSAPARLLRAATLLLVLELAQGLVGAVQYATGLPIVLVGFHVFGASVLTVAATWTLLLTRSRPGGSARTRPGLPTEVRRDPAPSTR
ncbi:MAG: COX15/CtaA family protein [Nocardioidaceae bacterium]